MILLLQFNRDENRTEGEGANCNRIIMFLTDGGTEMPEEVLDKYNKPPGQVCIGSMPITLNYIHGSFFFLRISVNCR